MSATMGGSTKTIFVRLARDLVDAPNANVAKDILTNDKLDAMQKKIEGLKEERNSIFGIQAQVAILEKNLTTMNPDTQKQLTSPIERLTHSINQGIIIDKKCAELETTLSEMTKQHLAMKKARHHPTEKTSEIVNTNSKSFDKTIDERTKEVDQLTKHFSLQHQQIVKTYSDTYTTLSNLPGGKPLIKPINALVTPEVESQQLRH